MKLGFGKFLNGPFNQTTIENALQKLTAAITGHWNVEHKEDGTHSAITADALTVAAGDLGVGTVGSDLNPTETDTYDLGTQSSEPTRPFYAWRTLRLGTSLEWCGTNTGASGDFVAAWTDSRSGSNRLTASNVATSQTWTIDAFGTDVAIFGGSYTIGGVLLVGTRIPNLSVALLASGAYYEGTRSTAMGYWIAVAHSAGNFTASTGSWTVDSGDQLVYRYTLIGKTMILSWSIANSDVSAGSVLRLAIPGSFTAAQTINGVHEARDNGGVAVFATCRTVSGQAYIELYPTAGTTGTWAITSSDNTATIGTFAFEVS